jgi:hypothetical protein
MWNGLCFLTILSELCLRRKLDNIIGQKLEATNKMAQNLHTHTRKYTHTQVQAQVKIGEISIRSVDHVKVNILVVIYILKFCKLLALELAEV